MYRKWINLVDPKEVEARFSEKGNALTLKVNGVTYSEVVPRKPFPLSRPNFIIFTTRDGEEICAVKDYTKMDPNSVKAVEKLLNKMYFIPKIKRVIALNYEGGAYVWAVETDKGRREFKTRGRRIYQMDDGKIVITDTHGNVYLIENPARLDRRSREMLEEIV